MKNMRNVMLTTLSKCGSIDITAHMINEEGDLYGLMNLKLHINLINQDVMVLF